VEPALKETFAGSVLKWVVGPAAVLVLSAALGEARASDGTGTLLARTAALPDAELRRLEGLSAAALANATWAFGSVDAVRKMTRTELERLPDGPERARVLLRLALVDDNLDGQAALIAQACVADPRTCDEPGLAAGLEAKQRFVSPGNRLPLFMLQGHPQVPR
jgi:hypothetical protein